MGQGARKGKVVALLVALALVAVAVPLAEPAWWWVTTKRAWVDGYVLEPIDKNAAMTGRNMECTQHPVRG